MLSEVQRAIAGASTSTAAASRSGGVLFVHRFGATLNAHVHLHLCMLDGVVAQGRQGLAFRGAQVGEACVQQVQVQAALRQRVLGRCTEGLGLPMLLHGSCAIRVGYADQNSLDAE